MAERTMSSAFDNLLSLPAAGPHPAYLQQSLLFGRFVGVWDMDVELFDGEGRTVLRGPGEWAFSWVLDGRAMQDVLTFADQQDPEAISPGKRYIGTSLRYYHPKTDRWRVVWVGATSGNLCLLEGGGVGDEIRLERLEEGSALLRWTFTDLTDDQFRWTGHTSTDGGASWRLEQEMHAKRRS